MLGNQKLFDSPHMTFLLRKKIRKQNCAALNFALLTAERGLQEIESRAMTCAQDAIRERKGYFCGSFLPNDSSTWNLLTRWAGHPREAWTDSSQRPRDLAQVF